MRKVLTMVLYAAALCACPGSCERSPTSSSDVGSAPFTAVLPEWSPFIGVHAFAARQEVQQPYLQPLFDSGAVRGIRTDVNHPDTEFFANWAIGQGIDVLAVFPNEHLRLPNAYETLSNQVRRNPDIKYWEFGNEVSLFVKNPSMGPEEYMSLFLELYEQATDEFPDRVFLPMPIFGGSGGSQFLQKMLDYDDGALIKLANHPDPGKRLKVLSVHVYGFFGPFVGQVKTQIERLPYSTEIWISEVGIEQQSEHISWVKNNYPQLRDSLRATRIYWYVFSECTEFSLIEGLAGACPQDPLKISPLYTVLTGGVQ